MLKAEQIPMEVQDALNKAHGFIISPQALAAALNAWPGMDTGPNIYGRRDAIIHLPLPLTQEASDE